MFGTPCSRRWTAPLLAIALGLAACETPPADPEPPADLDQLQSLPYLGRVAVPAELRDKSGVVVWERERASPGLNLFARAEPRAEAVLMDLTGQARHTWTSDAGQVIAGQEVPYEPFYGGWQHVELYDDDRSLLAIVQYQALLRLDHDSRVLWKADVPAHHDLAVSVDGTIYTFGAKIVREDGLPLLDNTIVTLSSEGVVQREVSLLELLRNDPLTASRMETLIGKRRGVMQRMQASLAETRGPGSGGPRDVWAFFLELFTDTFTGSLPVEIGVLAISPADVVHVNSIELLERPLAGHWARGDVLLSLRELNALVVVDRDLTRIRWIWGDGVLFRQHQPTELTDGNLLVFDNGRETSRVLEIDPARGEIVWDYSPGDFFSKIRGGSQKLPNGNVLITDSQNGRAVEVTPAGEVVWEYFTTDLDADGTSRGALYRMTRLPTERLARRLPNLED